MSTWNPRPRTVRETTEKRMCALALLLSFLSFFIVARLVQLQVVEHGRWVAAARAMQERTIDVPPRRGTIYDRNGVSLAFDVKAVAIAIDSFNMTKPETLVKILSEELGVPARSLEQLVYRPSYFTWLDRKVSLEAARAIERRTKAESAYGLIFIDTWKRCYPQGALASNLIGFVGTDGRGLEGLEVLFDSWLGGAPAKLHVVQGADGRTYHAETVEKGRPGEDLHLTVDSRLQLLCEEEIDRGSARFKPNAGFIVLLDPKSGEVLAMAQDHRYDLNRFQGSNAGQRKNLAVSFLFEPGSAFKAVSGLAALDCGAVRAEDRFNGNDGITLYGHTIHNSENKSYGMVPFVEVIAQSINTGMIRAAEKLGEERLYRFLVELGFGQKTGIALPGEENGILTDVADWSGLSLASTAIGQSVGVTGIQLARAMSVIANGGLLVVPRIVRDDAALADAPAAPRRVASEESCATMLGLLRGVVERGTGTLAEVEGFAVAGKTGTAQKAVPGKGYVAGKYTSLFAGFLPGDRPEYLFLIVLDEVKTTPVWGGYTAGQIFHAAASRLVQVEHLAPVAQAGSR
jgi:cell division protein FtsI/penicillin-binding protein 2